MVVAPLIDEVTPNFSKMINKYYGDNTYTYFKPQQIGLRYAWTAKFAPIDNVLIILVTKKPNYSAATDNQASSVYFLRSWNQSVGAYALVEHFQGYGGSRARSLDQTINGGRVDTSIDWISQLITKPSTTNPLTTPTMKQFSDITATPLAHVDSGSLPLTVNAIAYPQENFHITVTNRLVNGEGRAYNGSLVIDNNHVMGQEFSGDYLTVVGKDLNLEGHFDNVALASVPMVYSVKAATLTWTMTSVDHKTLSIAESASSEDEWKLNLAWDAILAVAS